jgi:hypothetical protein
MESNFVDETCKTGLFLHLKPIELVEICGGEMQIQAAFQFQPSLISFKP